MQTSAYKEAPAPCKALHVLEELYVQRARAYPERESMKVRAIRREKLERAAAKKRLQFSPIPYNSYRPSGSVFFGANRG